MGVAGEGRAMRARVCKECIRGFMVPLNGNSLEAARK